MGEIALAIGIMACVLHAGCYHRQRAGMVRALQR